MHHVIASAVLIAALFAGYQDKPAFIYKFTRGEKAKYEFTTQLDATLKGSDASFTVGGDDLWVSSKGTFELVTKDVTDDGTAVIERIMKDLTAEGTTRGKKFTYAYSIDQAAKEEEPADIESMEAAYFQSCRRETIYWLTSGGKLTLLPLPEGYPVQDWIGAHGRVGMLQWPVSGETPDTWAAPIFHDKITFKCTNEYKKGQVKSKLAFNSADIDLVKRPTEFGDMEITITVSGDAVIDLDPATGKFQGATLTLTMKVAGSRPGQNGAPDAILKGEATYKETVKLK